MAGQERKMNMQRLKRRVYDKAKGVFHNAGDLVVPNERLNKLGYTEDVPGGDKEYHEKSKQKPVDVSFLIAKDHSYTKSGEEYKAELKAKQARLDAEKKAKIEAEAEAKVAAEAKALEAANKKLGEGKKNG